MDDLRARISFQRDIRDCNIICLTETWLTPSVPDTAVTPSDNFSVLRMDRTAEAGKTKGGGGVSSLTRKWCDPRNISILSRSCSPHLEHLSIICRPFYLPREFSSIVVTAVIYHQRQIAAWLCLNYTTNSADISTYILTLHASLLETLTKLTSKRSSLTSSAHILSNQRTEYTRSLLHPIQKCLQSPLTAAFGKSDHAAIFLTPDYKQRILREPPVEREVTRWSPHSEATLQASLDDVDWTCSGRVHLTSANSRR